jgi:hypothetical protein
VSPANVAAISGASSLKLGSQNWTRQETPKFPAAVAPQGSEIPMLFVIVSVIAGVVKSRQGDKERERQGNCRSSICPFFLVSLSNSFRNAVFAYELAPCIRHMTR